MQLLNEEQIANFCVAHFSPSSIRKYLENPQGFFKNYVRYEYDDKQSPALIEGDAMHRVLEGYYTAFMEGKPFDWKVAAEDIIAELFNAETISKIDWGKTGSVEKSQGTIRGALDSYFNELPDIKPDEIVSVEERYLTDFEDLNNDSMPIPIKGFTDLVTLQGDEYVIRDHKFVSFFSDPMNVADTAKYEMQAVPYFFMVRKRYGKNPTRMIFDEVKKSKNRDGGAQRKEVVIEFTPKIINRWLEIYRRVVKSLAGIPLIDPDTGVMQFIPNPFAQFGEEAWSDFCAEVDEGRVWTFEEIKTIRASKYARAEEMDALF
jgi:hypothetical protein